MTACLEEVARLLAEHGVRYILIGGWAAILHGAARSTNDVDIVYARDADNIHRLVEALGPWQPYLRGAPPGLPFRWDESTVHAGLDFKLTAAHGEIDLLGEVTGGGPYEQLLPFSQTVTAFGVPLRVVTLERLIHLKRAAGRPRDMQAIAELEALWDEDKRGTPGGDG